MSSLPEFSFDHKVSAQSAKHDKINLVVEHGSFRGPIEKLDAFKKHLGGPPRGRRVLAGRSYSRIFNASGRHRTITIRKSPKGAATSSPIPLFSGSYNFRREEQTPGRTDDAVLATLVLSLNPTRFLRFQNPANYFPPRKNFTKHRATFFQERIVPQTDETALDGKDNYIPDTSEFQFANEGPLWSRNLRTYINGVLHTIEEDTTRAGNLPEVQLSRVQSDQARPFNLIMVETYFEFRFADPLQIVRDIGPLLRSFNELETSTAHYRLRRSKKPVLSRTWERDSLVITKNIRTGVKLKLYAKTDRRVRVEVVHDLTKARLPNIGRHTFHTLRGVYQQLEELRRDAANVVNDVFAYLQNRASIRATPLNSIDLLFDIAHKVGSHKNARTLVSILCNKGSISTLGPFTRALVGLKNAGILKSQERNQKQEYVVTAKYEHPLKMLQRYGNITHLTTRHRKRAASE